MGREGIAFTFVVPGEGEFLTNIERRINKQLKRDSIEGFEAVPPPPVLAEPDETETLIRKRLNPMHKKVKRRR